MRSQESLAAATASVRAKEGFVDMVIANAGIVDPSPLPLDEPLPSSVSEFQSAFWSMSFDSFNQVLPVNITAVFYAVVAFLDLLDVANRRPTTSPPRPKIQAIIVASFGGFVRNLACSFAYVASKR